MLSVVIGSKGVNATGLIRSLGQAGFDVTFASRSSRIESKYTTAYLRLPQSTEQWQPVLQAYLSKLPEKPAIFSVDDESAFYLDDNFRWLQTLAYTPNACGRLRSLADKSRMAAIAEQSGMPVPEYCLLPVKEALSIPQLPVILKPFAGFAGSKGDIRICKTDAEYTQAVQMYREKGYSRVIQQRFLDAPDQYEVGLMGLSLPDGRIVIPGTIHKLRSYPTGRGSTSYAKFETGLPVDEAVLHQFIHNTGYTGLFDMELMISDGKAWFIEVNFRNGQYGYITTAAGYNLPENWVRGVLGQEIAQPEDIRQITYINERDDYLHVKNGKVSRKQWRKEFHGAAAYGMFCKGDQRPYIRQYVKIPDRVCIAAKKLRSKLSDLLFREEWNVAIRPVDGHPLYAPDGTRQPFRVLKNSLRYWAADPFVISDGEKDYLFFEMFDRFKGKGLLGYREINPNGAGKMKIAFEGATHLSFPMIFKAGGTYYIMPESAKDHTLPLLRATHFPDQWERVENLMQGKRMVDSVLLQKDTQTYLLTHTIHGSYTFDTLELFLRTDDGWTPHPKNPVVRSASAARMAGKVIASGEGLLRVSQDCSEDYGKQLNFHRILTLSPQDYREQDVCAVTFEDIRCIGGAKQYTGIHTYNASANYEVIDLKNTRRLRLGNLINLGYQAYYKIFKRR